MNTTTENFKVRRLSDSFYMAYPNPPYIEILKKQQRAYNCLLFNAYNYSICIPYRTEITHNYSYRFKNSKRSIKHKSGLDYTKIVIISKEEYIDNKETIIDNDEFNETVINIDKIKQDALSFVNDYIYHINKMNELHPSEFKRRYEYSSLKYFHKEMGIKQEISKN